MQIHEQTITEQYPLDVENQRQIQKQTMEEQLEFDYEKIASSSEFQALLSAKKRFTVITTVFFLVFALLLPVLAFYTDILTKPFYGAISFGWVYAFAQFGMTAIICQIYVKKAFAFDKQAAQILQQSTEGDNE